jgi:hypothetical protein
MCINKLLQTDMCVPQIAVERCMSEKIALHWYACPQIALETQIFAKTALNGYV